MPLGTLLIIGNGFDLKCGLETKYIDFWRYQRAQHSCFDKFVGFLERTPWRNFDEENMRDIEELIEIENGVSFLEYYFTLFDWRANGLNQDETWSRIEDVLRDGFIKTDRYSLNFNSCFNCYDRATKYQKSPSYNDYLDGDTYQIINIYLKKIFKGKTISQNAFQDFIISELDAFSVSFSKYIEEQTKSHDEYRKLSKALIEGITGELPETCEIISFNYTRPFDSRSFVNIHGLASKQKIVLGIAGDSREKEESHKSWYYKATKEYRIAKLLASGIDVSNDHGFISDVYVYGLSLGEQDYDFFENMFNKFNILSKDCEVTIHFCYSVYGQKSREEIIEEITDRVTKLINTYGDSNRNYELLRSMIQNRRLLFEFVH